MTSSNPIAIFINNLGYDVDIYDVFNTSGGSQGLLTYTKLATVPSGATSQQVQTIHFASQLQAMRTGNIEALNNNYYVQFPVAVMAVSPFNTSNTFILTSNLQQGMEESFKFIKYAQANPTSLLAKNFATALGNATSQKTAVNKFFQGTGSFQQCTLDTWTAVFTWQAQFTSAWQGVYYLYSAGSGSVGSSGSSAPALVATLSIVSSAQGSSAVLTMAGANNENTTMAMVGDGTMQEQDPGTGNLSVTLTPSWLNVAQTSQQNGKTVTNYVIGAAFTGSINGTNVAGNLNQIALPDPSDTSMSATQMMQFASFSLTTFTSLVGMLTGIGMLYYMAKGHKQAETQKENEVQQTAANKADAEKAKQSVVQDYQKNEVSQVRDQAQKVETEIVPKVQEAYKGVNQAGNIGSKLDVVNNQINELQDVLESGAPSDATESAAETLLQARTDLEKAIDPATSATSRDAAVKSASTGLMNTSAELEKELANNASNFSQQEETALTNTKNALDETQAQTDSVEKAQQEQEQQDKNEPSDPVEDNQFDDPVAEPVGEI